ncbi:MAG: hypothetical protein D6805_01225 [Planctomycetota bacterium]|nr:MAG: hypothetical protein D6805_01225 [Planctomycetota bacterium]
MKHLISFLLSFLLLANLCLAENDIEKNRVEIKIYETDAELLRSKGDQARFKGNLADAKDHYNSAIKKYKDLLRKLKDAQENNTLPTKFIVRKLQEAKFHLGYCYFYIGELEDSRKYMEEVLNSPSFRGEAHYYLARILAKDTLNSNSSDKQKLENLQKTIISHLENSVKYGYNIFQGLEDAEELSSFKEDPKVIIRLLKTKKINDESQMSSLGDPFRPKVAKKEKEKEKEEGEEESNFISPIESPQNNLDLKEQQKILKNIEDTFKQLKSLQNKPSQLSNVPKIIEFYEKLNKLLENRTDISNFELKKRLDSIQQELNEMRDRIRKTQIEYYTAQCRTIIQNMENSSAAHQYDQINILWKKLNSVAREMLKIGANPTDLLNEARPFYNRARTYLELRNIRPKVTGIVIEEYPRKRKYALVNDRKYTVNQFILDKDGRPIPDLKLKDIQKGKVTFIYKGVTIETLIRESGSQP